MAGSNCMCLREMARQRLKLRRRQTMTSSAHPLQDPLIMSTVSSALSRKSAAAATTAAMTALCLCKYDRADHWLLYLPHCNCYCTNCHKEPRANTLTHSHTLRPDCLNCRFTSFCHKVRDAAECHARIISSPTSHSVST